MHSKQPAGECMGVEPAHLGCFVKDDSSVLDISVALIELCKGYPQRVQLANSLQTSRGCHTAVISASGQHVT